jgi:broad specificity phosphatase PhoE
MPEMSVIYLVRHGQTRWNAEERMQGWLDSELTAAGRRQAEQHAALLEREGVERLVVSPLGRTRATAEIINARLGVRTDFEPRLRERSCGVWEGLTLREIEHGWPAEIAARARDPFHHRPPGGENLPDVVTRVEGFLAQLLAGPEARIALVSHGIMSRAILTRLLELAPEEANRARQPNDLVYRISLSANERGCVHYRAGVGPVAGLFLG